MAKLSEYLGNIVAGLAEARVLGDLQTVKIAEAYAKHDLLQHFTVPYLRYQEAELTIPVVLDKVQEALHTTYEPIDNRKFGAVAYREVLASLGLKSMAAPQSQTLRSEIAKRTQELETQIRAGKNLDALSGFSQVVVQKAMALHPGLVIDQYRPAENLGEVEPGIEVGEGMLQESELQSQPKKEVPADEQAPMVDSGSLRTGMEALPTGFNPILAQERLTQRLASEIKITEQTRKLEDMDFIVEASRLREERPENVIFIKMKVTEQGMEWHRTDDGQGGIQRRLVAE
ncbi:MAG: hypothetical protein U0176_27175 [Bacteroidia bacterium]